MPQIVSEIMDPDFCRASQADSIGKLLHEMTELGLGSIPVVDLSGHPVGMATVGEIDQCRHLQEITEHPRHPAVSVLHSASIAEAARTLAQHNAERLLLVDEAGVAVGAVSALDLLRALLGFGVAHTGASSCAPAVPHWTAGELLHLGSLAHVPAAPGLIVLESMVQGAKIVWVESALNLRQRLDQMLCAPQNEPALEALLAEYPRRVTFRVLRVDDAERRARVLRAVQALVKRANRPQTSTPVA